MSRFHLLYTPAYRSYTVENAVHLRNRMFHRSLSTTWGQVKWKSKAASTYLWLIKGAVFGPLRIRWPVSPVPSVRDEPRTSCLYKACRPTLRVCPCTLQGCRMWTHGGSLSSFLNSWERGGRERATNSLRLDLPRSLVGTRRRARSTSGKRARWRPTTVPPRPRSVPS